MTPGPAEAQRHAGGSGGGWYGGGGWGWDPRFVWRFDLPCYDGYYYYDEPDCGWVRVRVWSNQTPGLAPRLAFLVKP